ncbi:hypothetical protein LU631_09280 [Erwinia tracheiphila]|uniref:Uncharacterized protein n=1 Tax=Erwinia tracheiphila TaxID=65700 RepID=A0A0M2KF32_9GAMM|nr:hypothetical protein [Erwinia tracheiphila]KKF37978.1 hypothetical protein SY86_01515 [Erwinia tracheiphila]KKF37985.1 hypothetical protein SY86_00050 [Erwinia tracheiphila]UIA89382.1 hypothetical protein LU631_09280 [Erwinia tracheiphila]UIA97765.1 hypothetical protein LU633_07965 [Erwinia tracheiphila]
MKTMIYKAGGKTRVWNTTAHVKVIGREDLAKYLAEGWLDHPSKLLEPLPEQEQEQEETETDGDDLIGESEDETPKKRGRKPKAAADETDD